MRDIQRCAKSLCRFCRYQYMCIVPDSVRGFSLNLRFWTVVTVFQRVCKPFFGQLANWPIGHQFGYFLPVPYCPQCLLNLSSNSTTVLLPQRGCSVPWKTVTQRVFQKVLNEFAWFSSSLYQFAYVHTVRGPCSFPQCLLQMFFRRPSTVFSRFFSFATSLAPNWPRV